MLKVLPYHIMSCKVLDEKSVGKRLFFCREILTKKTKVKAMSIERRAQSLNAKSL
jgi:hypothetical protein